ncbi:MAG: hypothetical protein HYV95_02025 [Opitutae bacterium]|nr:hypothetical protein [Opitutae bacterium]
MRWSQILTVVGCAAMLVGGIDPMEGSLAVLPGSGLFALAAYLGQAERPVLRARLVIFLLVAIGVGALWGMSAFGGVGGQSGHSAWWLLLGLPYMLGWSGSFWTKGAPYWYTQLGLVIGLWYMVIFYLGSTRPQPKGPAVFPVIAAIGVLGLLTAAGCAWRLWRTRGAVLASTPPPSSPA